MMNGKPIFWEELSTIEIKGIVEKKKMAIIPCGSVEQHGPHLPLIVDTLIVEELSKRISAKTGVPILPCIKYGLSQCQGNFPGVISVSPEILYQTLVEICHWLYKSGIRKILMLNGHGMNKGPILCAQEQVRFKLPDDIQIKGMTYWEVSPQAKKIFLQREMIDLKNIHANIAETACTMAIRPDLVKIERVVDEPDIIEAYWYYRKDQKTDSGIEGSGAGRATVELGENILSGVAEELIKWVEKAIIEDKPLRRSN